MEEESIHYINADDISSTLPPEHTGNICSTEHYGNYIVPTHEHQDDQSPTEEHENGIGSTEITNNILCLTYYIIKDGTQNGRDKVIDSQGFSYTRSRESKGIIYWRCSVRSKSNTCPATLRQSKDNFDAGPRPHNHEGKSSVGDEMPVYLAMRQTENSENSHCMSYKIIKDWTQQGRQKCIDSEGYSYSRKGVRKGVIYWRCIVRSKFNTCPATLRQKDNVIYAGPQPHNHDVNNAICDNAVDHSVLSFKHEDNISPPVDESIRLQEMPVHSDYGQKDTDYKQKDTTHFSKQDTTNNKKENTNHRKKDADNGKKDTTDYGEKDTIDYKIVKNWTEMGRERLIDSKGFSYRKRGEKNGIVIWRCSVRSKLNTCPATVRQKNNKRFIAGRPPHNHEGNPSSFEEVPVYWAIGKTKYTTDNVCLNYKIVKHGTQRGQEKLIDSQGFSYTKICKKKGVVYWRCSIRSKSNKCPATVQQKGNKINAGPNPHSHKGIRGIGEEMPVSSYAIGQTKVADDKYIAKTEVNYKIIKDGTQNGRDMLIDSMGFSYTKNFEKKGVVYWRCSIRSKSNTCPASVQQKENVFNAGARTHNHEGKPGIELATRASVELKRKVEIDPCLPAPSIVKGYLTERSIPDTTGLPTMTAMIKRAKRYRAKLSPRERADMYPEGKGPSVETFSMENFFKDIPDSKPNDETT